MRLLEKKMLDNDITQKAIDLENKRKYNLILYGCKCLIETKVLWKTTLCILIDIVSAYFRNKYIFSDPICKKDEIILMGKTRYPRSYI